jgi:hypothetical protein
MNEDEDPSGARTLAGCACAALVAGTSAAVAMWWQMPEMGVLALLGLILVFALPVAAAHALLLGLPLYLLLRLRWPLRWWSAALGGFAVAVIPVSLLSLPAGGGISLAAMGELATLGWCGLAGGLAFWVVLRDPQSHGF